MSAATLTQYNFPLKVTTPLGPDTLIMRALSGTEGISKLFDYKFEMWSEDATLDATSIVGKPVCASLDLAGGSQQYFHGIVSRFVQGGRTPQGVSYTAHVRPWLWLLTRTANCQIFQNMSVPDIVKKIFSDLGFTDFTDSLAGTYNPREYCVQYRESAFAFVSRLMEEEGIFYFFSHASDGHKLVLADDAGKYGTCVGPTTVRLVANNPVKWDDVITECTLERTVVSGKYQADDYDFEKPSTELLSKSEGTGDTTLIVYDYPGGFTSTGDGTTVVDKRIAAFETRAQALHGKGNCSGFHAGCKFTLSEHYRDDANKEYAIVSLKYETTQLGYDNEFEAIPATVTYRPVPTMPKPMIRGAQTATVVGKSGEEIWTDSYGRVKVKFHWDQSAAQDETASCWVRVAQPWAGQQWGGMFIPRIGQEVVVSFLEGNPDRPLITGSLFNGTNQVPYTLPDDQTKSTIKTNTSKGGSGFNELRFEDKKDSEEIFMQAQKDMNVTVLNDSSLTVKNNRKITVQEKDETHTVAKGNRTIDVTKGDETHSVGGKRTLTITGDESHTNKAKFTQDVTGDFTLKISGNLTIQADGSVSIKSGTDFTSKAGTSLTNEAGTALTNKAGTDLANKATAGLTNEGATISSKAQGMHSVESSGMLTVKGSMVKIN